MPLLKQNNSKIYYEVVGEGETIVFTHGASWDHAQWEPQIRYFSKGYQTIAWDVRGHGKSTLPAGKVDSNDFSKDLITLLDHLDVEKAHLCGLSMGGHISLQTAARYPERVSSLILIGTPFTNTFNRFEKFFMPINRLSNRFISMKTLGKWQGRALSKFNSNNKQYIEEVVSRMPHEVWLRLWDTISRMESEQQLQNIECPTLIMQGENDTMISRQQEVMHDKIKNSELKIIKQAHHATNLDQPEEVNRYMHDFIKK
ncbi:alpha/beta fold hydrolase [Bacillus sp. FSL K6-3431]|uniref:alpha/beta fold hydrolase n=1 Tax=Bacillus sp. FSL K6-3431 TaxID=2921500 RepID=UPI0030FAD61B